MKQSSDEGQVARVVAIMKLDERLSSEFELFIVWIMSLLIEPLPGRCRYAGICARCSISCTRCRRTSDSIIGMCNCLYVDIIHAREVPVHFPDYGWTLVCFFVPARWTMSNFGRFSQSLPVTLNELGCFGPKFAGDMKLSTKTLHHSG